MPIELNLHRPPPLSGELKPVFQKEALSQTDLKTYAVVVLSYLLIAVGLILAGSALYMATIVPPMVAMASPALPLVLGVLGLSSRNPSEMLFANPAPSWEKGQPLELNNLKNVNCWVNGPFQLICNVPAYYEALKKTEAAFTEKAAPSHEATQAFTHLFPLFQSANQYDQDKRSANRTRSSVDTQKLREWLYDQTCFVKEEVPPQKLTKEEEQLKKAQPITHRAADTQEDAWEMMKFFLMWTNHSLPIIEQTAIRNEPGHPEDGVQSITRLGEQKDPLFYISFELGGFMDQSSLSLESLLTYQFFQETNRTPTGEGTNEITKRFVSVPDDLTIYLNRTTYDYVNKKAEYQKPIKTQRPVDMPLEFKANKGQFGEDALFECDGFLVHSGEGAEGGHYYSYARRDGQWVRMNDTEITFPSVEEVKEDLLKAYAVHYAKKEKK